MQATGRQLVAIDQVFIKNCQSAWSGKTKFLGAKIRAGTFASWIRRLKERASIDVDAELVANLVSACFHDPAESGLTSNSLEAIAPLLSGNRGGRAQSTLHVAQSEAVVFTHFGSLHYTTKHSRPHLLRTYVSILKKYLKCNSICDVYAYIDYAIKKSLKVDPTATKRVDFDFDALHEEYNMMELVREAEREARLQLDDDGEVYNRSIHFHFIGIRELAGLIKLLIDTDERLVTMLAGSNGVFAYDSPKFCEAVIRIARANAPHLAHFPILRFDEDVAVNDDAIRRIVRAYHATCRRSTFFFFSGTYGQQNHGDDPLNDYAVRTHWFVDPKTQKLNQDLTRRFLSDLSVLGATQLDPEATSFSSNMSVILRDEPSRKHFLRTSSQAISGSGLIISTAAIRLLPPVMNWNEFVVWVDDHLKRRLHEAIGDIDPTDLECVPTALSSQSRYPEPITQANLDWAQEKYFPRLARGCMFRAIITNNEEIPAEFATLISQIVGYKVKDTDVSSEFAKIKAKVQAAANKRMEEVLLCWSSREYTGYANYLWATTLTEEQKRAICDSVVAEAEQYAILVAKWPLFCRAIDRLDMNECKWLYAERNEWSDEW